LSSSLSVSFLSLSGAGAADNSTGAADNSTGAADNSTGAIARSFLSSQTFLSLLCLVSLCLSFLSLIRPAGAGAADNSTGAADNSTGATDNSTGAADNSTGAIDNSTGAIARSSPASQTSLSLLCLVQSCLSLFVFLFFRART
jgi:hypothetical protein